MSTYNTYDFNSDAPFIPSKCCGDCGIDMNTLKETVSSTINNSMQETNEHIHCATHAVLKEVHDVKHVIHNCNKETEHEIGKMINGVHHHIDDKFNEIDFISQFENLNNQLKNLQHD